MAQTVSAAAVAHGLSVERELDLTDPRPGLPDVAVLPLGRRGQLHLLTKQLRWCEQAVRVAQREAGRGMRDADLDEGGRWDAVRKLRALAWKICAEVLPLVGRVPAALRAHPDFLEVERASHALRRATEDALQDNANYTADLVAAAGSMTHSRRS